MKPQTTPASRSGYALVRPPRVFQDARLRRFELKDALTAEDTNATAHPLQWTGSAYEADTDEEAEFEVYNPLLTFRGRGRSTSPAADGSRGFAQWAGDRGVWEITYLQPWCERIQCLVNMGSGLLSTDSTITVDAVEIMTVGGILPATTPTSVNNTFSWDADDDAIIIAVWNEDDDDWDADQVKCPA